MLSAISAAMQGLVAQDLYFCQHFHLVQSDSFKILGSETLEMCLGNILKLYVREGRC